MEHTIEKDMEVIATSEDERENTVKCLQCSVRLTHKNTMLCYSQMYQMNKIFDGEENISVLPHCLRCMEDEYDLYRASKMGHILAISILAARYDIPFFEGHKNTKTYTEWRVAAEKSWKRLRLGFMSGEITRLDMRKLKEFSENLQKDKAAVEKARLKMDRTKAEAERVEIELERKQEELRLSKLTKELDKINKTSFSETEALKNEIKELKEQLLLEQSKQVKEEIAEEWEGCVAARKKWNNPKLTEADFAWVEELERIHLEERPNIDAEGEHAIREFCKLSLKFEQSTQAGEANDARIWQQTMENALKRVNQLKSQVSATGIDRVSGLVEHIERTIGGIPTLKELLQWLFESLPEMHGYKITTDAADMVLLDLMNHYRENDGDELLYELPEHLRIEDRLGEFVPKEQQSAVERNTLALLEEYKRAGSFDGMDLSAVAKRIEKDM